ncbi:hypothetical protein I4U23_016788 [Adineta vaga]|nr:hypothetical protein I4U23_016788 [Adineta vaga]
MIDDEHAKNDMLKKCIDYYRHSQKELENIERFRSTYTHESAIYWYTIDSFMCTLLNRAFRTENIQLIYAFRYFIIDLCTQLEKETDIKELSNFKDEHEVLFSIDFDSNLNLWKVQLTNTDDGWEYIEEYLQIAEDEMKDMIFFSNELGQIDCAEKYFRDLLKTLPCDHPDIAALNIGLGHVCIKRGDYRLALEKYQRVYEIRQETLSILNPRIASSLRNFGNTCRAMGNFDQALFYFREAMKIYERNYSLDHICIAMTFEEIDALKIFKRILPSQHPQIAHCLVKYLHEELKMDEICLPSEHYHINNDLNRIVDTYKTKHEYMIKINNLQRTIW